VPLASALRRIRSNPAETALIAALVVLAVLVRWAGRHELTYDMLVFIRWYHQLEEHGRVHALSRQVGNYNAPYLYLLVLTTYLPGAVILKIKAIYVVFDALLAYFVYKIVALHRPGRAPIVAALAVLLLPTVTLNASFWGQTDSMWASFAAGGVYFLLRDRPWWAVAMCGAAVAFKPQGVFVLPLLLLCALAGRLRWRALLAAPAVYFLLCLPAILLGRNPIELFTLYEPSRQAKYTTTALDAHAPSVFAFLPLDGWSSSFYSVDARIETLRLLGYGFTAALVLGVCYVLVARRVTLTPVMLVTAAALFSILVPFTLPGMHERYFYLGDALTVVLAFYRPRLWFVPLMVQTASLGAYTPSLFGWYHAGPLMMVLATVMGAAVVVLGYTLFRDALSDPTPRPEIEVNAAVDPRWHARRMATGVLDRKATAVE
jgi:Gpi18-like mannosyltransferase